MFDTVEPVIDYSVRELCRRPYPRHPKGCPNFGKRPTCPPAADFFSSVYGYDRPVIVVWNVFDLKAHVDRMRAAHPGWSQAQLECCLYWQGTARKQLKNEIWNAGHLGMKTETCPEAMGVNVTATMAKLGVELEWPPVNRTVQVALLAYPKTTT